MNWNLKRKFHDVRQNSDEWFDLRLGKITSSNFDKICANMGKSFGNPAKEYAQQKALERVTNKRYEDGYTNSYMERGQQLEPLAIDRYEIETFSEVKNGGFSSINVYGDSTDGMIGSNGCIEIKSVIPKTHWKNIQREGCDPSYKWQIQGHLLISDKDWCDYVSYCPEFPYEKQIYIQRIEKEINMQDELKERLIEFEELVKHYVKLLTNDRS